MTRPKKRQNLAVYITKCLDAPLRAAIAGGGSDSEVAAVVSGVLNEPAVLLRCKSASPQERDGLFRKELGKIITRLRELNAPIPWESYSPGGPEAKHLPGLDNVAKSFPGLASPDLGERLSSATPAAVDALLTAATVNVTQAADDALKESTPEGGESPTQREIAEWIATDCKPETLRAVADKLADLWNLDRALVTVTGWAYGGLTTWRNGNEYHVPAGTVLADFKSANSKNPLTELVFAWQQRRPISAEPNLRSDRILPAKLAMVPQSHERAGRLLRRFSPAAHRRGELVLPGFGVDDGDLDDGPALPLALYHLGRENPHRGGGHGAPLAQRLFVESVLAAPYHERAGGHPVALQVTLRELLERLYPLRRKLPPPAEYWPRLMRAVEAPGHDGRPHTVF